MREEASFRMLFEKFRASKLEIDDPIPPKKINVYVEILQAILLLKALREEDFGHEL